MRLQITNIKESSRNGEIRKSYSVDCGLITLGRGTDQVLHTPDLRSALQHARLVQINSRRFRLESISPAGVLLNDRRVRKARVRLGDRIVIGSTEFRLATPDAEHDAAIEVRQHEQEQETSEPHALQRRVITTLGLSRRTLAWVAFLLVLTIGLALPVAGFFKPELRPLLRGTALPSDHFWLSGELSSGHHYFGADCNVCHQQAFQPAQDDTCLECHDNSGAHARIEELAEPRLLAQQCESCHKEHNGEALIPDQQQFCADCHQDIQGHLGINTELAAVRDFGLDHPEFKASLLQRNAQGDISQHRVALDDPLLAEQSFLTFPHDVHLQPEGLETPQGQQVLECANCHQVNAGGRYMQPIQFQAHCGGCHQLNFDPSNPDRVVPHGKPAEVVDVLTEFYAELALRGASGEVSLQSVDSDDPAAVLLWARTQALTTGDKLFQGRACSECHQVSRQQEGNRVSWEVLPARVAGVWFPKSRFSHQSHRSTACVDCHQAATSDSSADVLMPPVASCQSCHGGQHAGEQVASTCISCHRFHDPSQEIAVLPAPPQQGMLYLWDKPDVERIIETERPPRTRRRRPGEGD